MFVGHPPELTGRPPWWQRAAGLVRDDLREAADGLPADVRGLLPGLVDGDASRLDPVLASAVPPGGPHPPRRGQRHELLDRGGRRPAAAAEDGCSTVGARRCRRARPGGIRRGRPAVAERAARCGDGRGRPGCACRRADRDVRCRRCPRRCWCCWCGTRRWPSDYGFAMSAAGDRRPAGAGSAVGSGAAAFAACRRCSPSRSPWPRRRTWSTAPLVAALPGRSASSPYRRTCSPSRSWPRPRCSASLAAVLAPLWLTGAAPAARGSRRWPVAGWCGSPTPSAGCGVRCCPGPAGPCGALALVLLVAVGGLVLRRRAGRVRARAVLPWWRCWCSSRVAARLAGWPPQAG